MNNSFEERKRGGQKFEEEMFNVFQKVNEIKHSSDRIVWINEKPIFIEFKSSPFIEEKSWRDQNKIYHLGYRVIICFKKSGIIYADWIENIGITIPHPGTSGSFNPYCILSSDRYLEDFIKELRKGRA